MENFKRLNKNSKLRLYALQSFMNDESTLESIEENNIVVQMVADHESDTLIVEYISKLEADIEDEPKSKHDIDFENYLDTIINKDPFGGKYSGMKIRTVFEQGDEQWLRIALEQMKNEFIRDRLQYILDRGGYGKIINK